MATVTIFSRPAGKAHLKSVLESDLVAVGGLALTAAGTASLYNDAFTTAVTIGGSATTTGTMFTGAAMTTLDIGTGMGAGDDINIGGASSTTTIGGDLVVNGTTSSVNSEVVNIADNHLYLNADYTVNAAQTGGLVVNYLPLTGAGNTDTEAAGGFTAATTVATTGAATFTAGDFVQVSGANTQANDGLYEVLTHAGNVLTIDSTPTHSFAQTAFTVDTTGSTATFTKVTVSALQAGTDGTWEVGSGSDNSLTFSDLATAAGSDWATVLAAGNTSGANNPTISTGQSLLGAAELTMASTGANVVSLDTGGAAAINIGGTNANDINIGAGGASVDIGTTTSGAITINSGGTIAIGDGSAGAGTWDSAAGLSLDAATASNFTVTGAAQDLTLEAAGGGAQSVVISSAGTGADAIDLNASAGGATIDAVTGFSIDASNSAASNITSVNTTASTNTTLTLAVDNTGATAGDATLDINATSTNGSGAIDMDADDSITIDTLASGTISIGADAVAGTLNYGTGAAAKTVTIGSLTTTSSTLIQSGATGDITFDGQGMTTPLPFNGSTAGDTGNQDLSSNFTATTLIGVLNELKEAGVAEAQSLCEAYDTTNRAVGEPVIIDGDNSADTATDASAIATTEGYVGIVTVAAAAGEVCTYGTASAQFIGGLTGGTYPAAGDPVYLSTTTGRVTTDATVFSPPNDVVYQIGVVKDASTLTVTTTVDGDLAQVHLQPYQLIEL